MKGGQLPFLFEKIKIATKTTRIKINKVRFKLVLLAFT